MSATKARWKSSPYSFAAADALARELGLSPVTAAILVRRGHSTPELARRFLAAADRHDPFELPDMERACELILAHVRQGSRIVVHGDYDVDGVCATATVVESLRAAGADPAWHLPGRLDEGYGLSPETVDELARRGTGLLITADCAITATAEVDRALGHGIDVIVTDHHRPGERLPRCPTLHPGLGGYPFPELCAAGVAHKLAAGLLGARGLDPQGADEDLDLVALATVCDVVPLRGENRRLVREGLAALRRTRRPGLRALMRVAALEAGAVDERAVAFRLGPRLNAAGRVRRADAALELLMTDEEGRAAEVADELELLNRERRDVETRILFAAEAARTEQADAPAYVLAGEGWHPGVIGIVASRIAERHHRPCVMVSLGADGGRGSARSVAGFDLHAALGRCSRHLRRFGGHRAAAGLELDSERLDAFRAEFVDYAAAALSVEDLTPVEEVDAVVPGGSLGLPLAEELRRLAPFGHGNPEPRLLVPAARVEGVTAMGDEEQHARFTLVSGGLRSRAVAFRTPARSLAAAGDPHDAAIQLELREWMGAVEARSVLRALCPTEPGRCRVLDGDEAFWPALQRELSAGPPGVEPGGAVSDPVGGGRAVRARHGEGLAGVAGELLAGGEGVLVVCADAGRRLATLERLVAGMAEADLPVASWHALAARPSLARDFEHVLAIDPPPVPDALEALDPGRPDGFVHLAWGPHEVDFALAVARSTLDLREPLAEVYRGLRLAGGSSGAALERLLRGEGAHPRAPEVCARLVGILSELGLVEYAPSAAAPACRALEAPRTALERSPTHRACARRLERSRAFLLAEAARLGGSGGERRAVAAGGNMVLAR